MARAKERDGGAAPPSISIIGPGTKVFGDCVTDGTLRVEGVVNGTIYADKSVVVARNGSVHGGVHTQEAVILGEVTGKLLAASRLEVQSGARIEGEVQARRMELADGAFLNGRVLMGEDIKLGTPPTGTPRTNRSMGGTEEGGPSRSERSRRSEAPVTSVDTARGDGEEGAGVRGVGVI